MASGVYRDLPVTLEVLYAATVESLPGYLGPESGWIDFTHHVVVPGGLVEFTITHPELGAMGKVKLRKQDDRRTEMTIEGPPRPTDDEAIDYAETLTPDVADALRRLAERVGEQRPAEIRAMVAFGIVNPEGITRVPPGIDDPWGKWLLGADAPPPLQAYAAAEGKVREWREALERKREEHHARVVTALFSRLSDEGVPPTPERLREGPDTEEAAGVRPKWWPKHGSTKVKWKASYRKLKPLREKHGDNLTAIARDAKMSRERVSHIFQWAELDPEAHK